MADRKLCGVYFRIKRNDAWEAVCFSDMTEDEQREVLKGKGEEFVQSLAMTLAKTIKELGDTFDLSRD